MRNGFTIPQKRTGRPRTDPEIVELVLRMARENVSCGYKRIEGALHNLGYQICSSTVANILKQHGIEPAPKRVRQLSWCTFLKAHLDVLLLVRRLRASLIPIWAVIAHAFHSLAPTRRPTGRPQAFLQRPGPS